MYTQLSVALASQKRVKIVYLLESTYLKSKENIYLKYMNINHQPAATRLMSDIKHQPNRVLVDV